MDDSLFEAGDGVDGPAEVFGGSPQGQAERLSPGAQFLLVGGGL